MRSAHHFKLGDAVNTTKPEETRGRAAAADLLVAGRVSHFLRRAYKKQQLNYWDRFCWRALHCFSESPAALAPIIADIPTMPNPKLFSHSLRDQGQLLSNVAADAAAVRLLEASTTPETQAEFEAKLFSHIPPHFQSQINKLALFRNFLAWCNNSKVECPPILRRAIASRKLQKENHRTLKRDFVTIAGLNWPVIRRDQFLSTIPVFTAKPLDAPYPPLGFWVYESESIRAKWAYHITEGPQPDNRKKRLPMMALDPALLAFDVDAAESRIFVDKLGKLVAIVLRDFCIDEAARAWLDQVILEAVRVRKSIRVCFRLNFILGALLIWFLCSLKTLENLFKLDIQQGHVDHHNSIG